MSPQLLTRVGILLNGLHFTCLSSVSHGVEIYFLRLWGTGISNAISAIQIFVPIKISIFSGTEGVVQIVRCLQSATKEVTDVLLFECNIIYECRVCKSLFRGVCSKAGMADFV